MPIAYIEKGRRRARERSGFAVGTWLDKAAYDAHDLADDWPDDDDSWGLPRQVLVGYTESFRYDQCIREPVYEWEESRDALWQPVNPDYQEPEHIAICGACSRRIGCRAMPDTLGCMEQRYPASKQELLEWYAKHSGWAAAGTVEW